MWQEKQNNVKKFDDDIMPENCDVTAIFSIYGLFVAIRKPDSGCLIYKTYIFIKFNLFTYKSWKQN